MATVVLGILVLGFNMARADVQSSWLSSIDPTIQKTTDLPNNQFPALSNRDCVQENYTLVNPTTGLHGSKSDCFTDSAIGQMGLGGSPIMFPNSSLGFNLHGYQSDTYLLSPIPNQTKVLSFTSAPVYGLYIHFYSNLERHLTQNTFPIGLVTSYSVNAAPDIDLKDKTGALIPINPNTLSFSSNGQWMVVDAPTRGFLRVNLDTLEVTPFATSLNAPTDFSSKSGLTSISDDGRYAAVASDNFSYFKIYDLSTCTGATTSDYTKLLDCQSRDYWPTLNNELSGFRAIYQLRFMNDDNISVTAVYNWHTVDASSFKAATFVITAAGKSRNTIDYLALGDSYVSGQGEFVYKDGTDTQVNSCHLSPLSYPFIIGTKDFSSYESVACSGALTGSIVNIKDDYAGQVTDNIKQKDRDQNAILNSFMPGMLAQVTFVKKYQPKVVTLSIGGNDIGFADIVQSCVAPRFKSLTNLIDTSTCYNNYDERLQLVEAIGTLYSTLQQTYQKILAADPGVQLYVTGYPQVIVNGDCGDNVHMNADEIQFSQQLISYLNWTIHQAADSTGVRYVDIENALAGHRLCETNSSNMAINGITAGNDTKAFGLKIIGGESFHPTVLGHQLLAQAVAQETSNLTQAMPVADASITRPEPTDPLAISLLNNFHYTGTQEPDIASDDDTFVNDTLLRASNSPISANGFLDGLAPNSQYQITLRSDPVVLGTLTSDADGNLNGSISIPADTEAGFHTIHILGQNMAGERIDIYKIVYVAASTPDYDGDGVPNAGDQCLVFQLSGHDVDQDGIDDACDPSIGAPPVDPYPFKASLVGNSIIITRD